MHWNWHWLSALGNAALVLPLFGCTILLLAMQSPAGRTTARRWLNATAAACVLVAGSKIAFYGWGTGVKAWNLAMPSGHATLALAFWPVLLAVLVPERRRWRYLATATGVALGVACALSRVALRAHPPSEAIAGCAIGLAAMAMAVPPMQLRLTIPRSGLAAAGLMALLLWANPHSLHLPSERWLARAGAWLSGQPTPVSRRLWPPSFKPHG